MLLFNTEINNKNAHIVKLEKEIGYLSTLLSYWKPLDEQEDLRTAVKNKEQPIQHQDSLMLPETIVGRNRAISFRKETMQESQMSVMSHSSERPNPM